jgi:hypothetical protein
MAEKRKITRHLKRLKIRFGVNNPTSLAFTEDFSEMGIFIRSVNVIMPGTTLRAELFLPDNDLVEFEGKVVWGRRIPGSLIHLAKKSGMGIMITKFLSNEEKYLAYCRILADKKTHLAHPAQDDTRNTTS